MEQRVNEMRNVFLSPLLFNNQIEFIPSQKEAYDLNGFLVSYYLLNLEKLDHELMIMRKFSFY